MKTDYRLTTLVSRDFLILSLIGIFIIEYLMIVDLSFPNFPSPTQSIQLYLVMTTIVIVIYNIIWDVRYGILLRLLVKSYFFIIPIGAIFAVYSGHRWEDLTDFTWQFTHDTMYVVVVTQTIVLMIWLMGLKDYEEVYYEG